VSENITFSDVTRGCFAGRRWVRVRSSLDLAIAATQWSEGEPRAARIDGDRA
jgi:hypothetical protein